ncbi:MAG: DciA family protein [Hyphomonas sp.]
MVTRSSIDPIEEARARVRLRYMRGRAVTPGMAKIGVAAERLTRKSGAKKLPPIQILKARWREIAGEQLYKYCRPERLSGGKDGRVLTLRVVPQAAPMVQHQSETIRQRVSVAAGGDVTAIKLVQGPLTSTEPPKKPRRIARPLTPKERADLEASTAGIQDKRLREAIVALGAAMLTAEDKEQRPD